MNLPPDQEKRRFIRIPFDGVARLHCGGSTFDSTLVDVSLKGALFARPAGWDDTAAAAGCSLELLLGQGDVVISMTGGVAHTSGNYIGFRCDHIELESIAHLRRLLELNLGDPQLLERDLIELAGGGER